MKKIKRHPHPAHNFPPFSWHLFIETSTTTSFMSAMIGVYPLKVYGGGGEGGVEDGMLREEGMEGREEGLEVYE
jgi:hypothetical protein